MSPSQQDQSPSPSPCPSGVSLRPLDQSLSPSPSPVDQSLSPSPSRSPVGPSLFLSLLLIIFAETCIDKW